MRLSGTVNFVDFRQAVGSDDHLQTVSGGRI